ncbi:fungal-specific transcription factor domain-domain-containing protein [Naematelia encephala]|uniref:Fungal-specific transcription factor domain-domain-containing protein n=1 Tax=Naematelia encephala TaxID=71784 RepID=A0A1Y2APT3_9TREE|nr:fungal-specific transcription factor domain-domain-containing protein [Naematelia encephala]
MAPPDRARQTSEVDQETGSARKRRRTAQACAPCRAKKTKCDGHHPICTPCRDLGVLCSYPLDSSGTNTGVVLVSKNYMEALETRLQKLESQLREANETALSIGPSGAIFQPQRLPSGDSAVQPDIRDEVESMVYDVGGPAHSSSSPPIHGPMAEISQSSPATLSRGVDVFIREDTLRTSPMAGPNENPYKKGADGQDALTTASSSNRIVGSNSREVIGPRSAGVDGMGLLPSLAYDFEVPSQTNVMGQPVMTEISSIAPDQECYGDTSGISFHSLLLNTLLPGYKCLESSEDPRGLSGAAFGEVTGFLGLGTSTEGEFFVQPQDLPTRNEAHGMWDFFVNNTHRIYPFVAMETLMQSYLGLLLAVETQKPVNGQEPSSSWTASNAPFEPQDCLRKQSNQPTLALHFLIFALVQSLSERPPPTGKDVYRVALRLLRKHIDWPHSTIKAQVLLFGTMLMQGVDCLSLGWDLLGYAIRTAYAIGLHDGSKAKDLTPLEKEIRSRVWWGCFTFDRLLTVSIGRPSSITTKTSTLPLPSPLRGEHPSAIRFFCESIRLYSALSDLVTEPPALSSLRSTTADSIQTAALAAYKLEKEYAHWSDSVCSELRLSLNGFMDPLGVVLALRGMTMRLLLHRPIVLAAIRQQCGMQSRAGSPEETDQKPLQRTMEIQQRSFAFGLSLAAVIETATMTVWLLEKGGTGVGALSAPWYQLFYATNAFMTLVAVFLLDLTQWESFIKTPGTEMTSALYKAQGIVKHISAKYNRPNARRALMIIDHLLQALVIPGQHRFDPATATITTATVPSQGSVNRVENPNNAGQTMSSGVLMNGEPLDLGDPGGLEGLPHLDFDELYRTLDLDVPPQAAMAMNWF